MVLKSYSLVVMSVLFFYGCSQTKLSTNAHLPERCYGETVGVFALDNFTDTPQAGMRASNLVEGVLIARGLQTRNLITSASELSYDEKIALARKEQIACVMLGGVSEWRYKTGIDGEPAISLPLKLVDTLTGKIVWSATGSDNSWGTSSIGTTAQNLLEKLVRVGDMPPKTER